MIKKILPLLTLLVCLMACAAMPAVQPSAAPETAAPEVASPEASAPETAEPETTIVPLTKEGETEDWTLTYTQGSYGYEIAYDPAKYEWITNETGDHLLYKDPNSTLPTYIAFFLSDMDLQTTIDGLVLQNDATNGSESFAGQDVALVTATDEEEGRVTEFRILSTAAGTLVVEKSCPAEALEGLGAELDALLSTFRLTAA